MGDFDHKIIHVTVDISKELLHKSVENGLFTELKRLFERITTLTPAKRCFDFPFVNLNRSRRVHGE